MRTVAFKIQMVKNNEIEDCNVFKTKDGSEAIRSNADGDLSNNLDNLHMEILS